MRVAYITAHTPFGRGETFVLDEMLSVAEQGVELLIVPRNPARTVFHDEARQLIDRVIWLPLFNGKMIMASLKMLVSGLKIWRVLKVILRHSRTLKILIKNLAVTPKAVFIAELFRKAQVTHIHAHWGSTTATMAWIASELTGIPWSFTLHRWDITENNLLEVKVKRGAFVRCISEEGRKELLDIVGNEHQDKAVVLHCGARIPKTENPVHRRSGSDFVIVCPANLVPKKGHRFLIEACGILVKKGIKNFRCLIIGDGPLGVELRRQVSSLGLEKVIEFPGRLPHERLLQMYEKGEVDVVVLPSIVTDDGEKEGIPVALMEAMAYGIPVVSTNTGGIPELLSDGAGLIVEQKNSKQLADVLEKLFGDQNLAQELARKGYSKVVNEFNLSKNVKRLIGLMGSHQKKELGDEYLDFQPLRHNS